MKIHDCEQNTKAWMEKHIATEGGETDLMGLDTTHDCWHGSYSAFNRWRHAVAEAAGYHVLPVKYSDGTTMDCIMVDWGHLQENIYGEWEKTPSDPLLVLIAHSDCEGVIHPEQAIPLASRLEEIAPKLRHDGEGHISNYQQTTLRFAAGLRKAAKNREDVDFH